MKTKMLNHCGGECDRCWVRISWSTVAFGIASSLLLLIGVTNIVPYLGKLPLLDLLQAIAALIAVFVIRAWFTARLVTFLLHFDHILENCLALIALSVIPIVAEVMYLCRSKGGETFVRPFLIPHYDLSASTVSQEIRKRDVYATATSDNTLTVYMDKQAIEVQINEENHSMCIDGEQIQICCLDDAADLAKIILAQKT